MPTLTAAQVMAYAAAAGWSGQDLIDATSTTMAESSGRTDVVNASGNTGLLQIGPKGTVNDAGVGLTSAQLKDPGTNMAAGHAIWLRDGRTFAKSWSSWGDAEQVLWAKKLGGTVPAVSSGVTTISSPNCSGLPPGSPGYQLCMSQGNGGTSVPGVPDLSTLITDAGKTAAWVANPLNWMHVIFVVAGIGVAIVGLNVLAKPLTNGPIVNSAKSVAKTATKL